MKQLGYIIGKSIFMHERGKELSGNNSDHKDGYLYKKCCLELKNNDLISLG